jgi:hypothetical protein
MLAGRRANAGLSKKNLLDHELRIIIDSPALVKLAPRGFEQLRAIWSRRIAGALRVMQ